MGHYLLQTGSFKQTSKLDIEGFDSLVRVLALFYAEYEDGSLPCSLKRMTKDFDNMEFFTIKFRKTKKHPFVRTVKVLANIKEDGKKEEIIQKIKDIGNWKMSTKGYSNFPSYLEYEKLHYPYESEWTVDLWWSIEDDFMFFVEDDENSREEKLIIAFEKLKEKWKYELFPEPKKSIFDKLKETFMSRRFIYVK